MERGGGEAHSHQKPLKTKKKGGEQTAIEATAAVTYRSCCCETFATPHRPRFSFANPSHRYRERMVRDGVVESC